MTTPSVSILVPICNVERYLRECLTSLVNQTLRDIEIICIDDGSTDGSLAVIQEYAYRDPRIVVLSKPNSGYGDSMNQGLDLARGEFIGIVESDDFAALEMFETLYGAAVKHGVDIVRTNYYAHRTEDDPEKDVLVDNLYGCHLGHPFAPMDHRQVFMRQPAIWTGLYRKSMLDENDVRFLPTPGASFQDTSFYFKAFYAAHKVLLLKEGYLHYRIDNAGSSVKNQNKVFPICEEYAEVWRYAQRDAVKFGQIKTWIPRQQYDGYTWNLNRLSPEMQPKFFERFSQEYAALDRAGLLVSERFDDAMWRRVGAIVNNPARYFERAYGLQSISTSVILGMGECSFEDAKKLARSAASGLPSDCELFVCHAESERIVFEIRNEELEPGAIRSDLDIVHVRAIGSIDPSALRGSCINIIGVSSNDDGASLGVLLGSRAGITTSSIGFSVVLDSDRLWLDTNGMCSLPFSVAHYLLAHDDVRALPVQWGGMLCAQDNQATGFADAARQVMLWSKQLMGCDAPYEVRRSVYSGLLPVWSFARGMHAQLPWNELQATRELYRSMADVGYLAYEARGGESCAGTPDLSVIVPVYNTSFYLKECLDSILKQTFANFEVLLINDGSKDDSLGVLERYADQNDRVKVFSQFNCGAGAARNLGIRLARGKRLIFIDPDDRYPSNHVFSDLVAAMDCSGARMCGGSFSMLETSGEINTDFPFSQSFYRVPEERDVSIGQVWSDYGWIRFMYDSSLFSDGALSFPQLNWYEDPVFFLSAIKKAGGYHEIPSEVYLYRHDYKETVWTVSRTRDMLAGILANLRVAYELNMSQLFIVILGRIDHDYLSAVVENYADDGVFRLVLEIQRYVNEHQIDGLAGYYEPNRRLKALTGAAQLDDDREVLVERLAHRIARSSVYKNMQCVFERFH